MKIQVKVKTKAKNNKIEKKDNLYYISVKQTPINQKANKEIEKIIAKYFNKRISQVNIVSGIRSKNKIIEIF